MGNSSNYNRRTRVSWAFYDWANSAFALTVMAAFFPGFFKGFWSVGVDASISTARLGFGNALAGLLVALLSPILGAIAGVSENRKLFMLFFVMLGIGATATLYFVGRGEWIFALVVFIFARIGFNLANLFYDTFLVDIAPLEKRHTISSWGYGVGYLGCGILFIINMIMYSNPSFFGIKDSVTAIRIIILSAACWWALFSIPFFLFVNEKKDTDTGKTFLINIKLGLLKMVDTANLIIKDKKIFLFLLAYWFYIDGVHTVVMMATDFGLTIGIDMPSLMKALLVVQLVAFPSAIIFGYIAQKIGAVRAIFIAIFIYIIITSGGVWFLDSPRKFMFFAGLTGTAQGAIQALSRSLFSSFVPKGKEGEYFGFYNMAGRFAIILGPVLVATSNIIFHNLGFNSDISSRVGISVISLLFIFGAFLLKLSKVR